MLFYNNHHDSWKMYVYVVYIYIYIYMCIHNIHVIYHDAIELAIRPSIVGTVSHAAELGSRCIPWSSTRAGRLAQSTEESITWMAGPARAHSPMML
jgi:hypothetical protein